ncbi:cytochrome ubiquinol oxidase subunit I [Longispora sp. K20-0274]|uniref:cytochrome ubiquinol oxidase subunit I n=1 Tax=Longispora sp. K20-0274 TaxID=3088255 RepID=UPI00399BF366
MDTLDLARWQFGITTVYHFLFVPLTIGLIFLVAGLQTAWHRTGDEKWLKLTKFYGKIFLINFAMGVVTGIVQEFQFGMNWSDYSRFVGDIFGAPLAIEGLVAFFLESTFLGLWIFGWDRLPARLHLAAIWAAAIGTALSAYFILAANSFMQWPVGFTYNQATKRAELTDFPAVLTNKVVLATLPHTLAACMLTGGGLVLGVALFHLVRGRDTDRPAFRSAAKLGAWTMIVAFAAVALSGDQLGKVMTETQPMKMAAAEALYQTEKPASFSIVTIGTLDGTEEVWALTVPNLLSFLGTGSFDGEVKGINNLQSEYRATYGPGDYAPVIPVTYWGFRAMIGFGAFGTAIALLTLWTLRKGRAPTSKWLLRAGLVLPLLPLAANSAGWIFTEMGRQPWAVFGLLKTAAAVSPSVSTGEVITSLTVFTLLYGILAVIETRLLLSAAKKGLPDVTPPEQKTDDDQLAFAY